MSYAVQFVKHFTFITLIIMMMQGARHSIFTEFFLGSLLLHTILFLMAPCVCAPKGNQMQLAVEIPDKCDQSIETHLSPLTALVVTN